MTTIHTPDWEQRRYEIAKDIVAGQLASPIIEGVDPNPSMQVESIKSEIDK